MRWYLTRRRRAVWRAAVLLCTLREPEHCSPPRYLTFDGCCQDCYLRVWRRLS